MSEETRQRPPVDGRGRDEAFSRFVAEYHDELVAYCRSILSGVSGGVAGEDCAQDALVVLNRRLGEVDIPRDSWRAYVWTTAKRRCFAALRDAQRQSSELDEAGFSAIQDGEEAADSPDELWRTVRQGFLRLGPAERELLVLAYLSRSSRARIAEVLASEESAPSAGAVAVRLHRVMVKLREICREQRGEDGAGHA